jgi:hypothetical protein
MVEGMRVGEVEEIVEGEGFSIWSFAQNDFFRPSIVDKGRIVDSGGWTAA